MEQLTTALDQCNIADEKSIKGELTKGGEEFVLSCTVFKFNDYKKRQERNILISTKSFYNLEKKTIKRKIDLAAIKGITVGTYGYEFVIHIQGENDYRFESQKRDVVIYHLIDKITQKTGKKIPYYQKDDICLYNYSTTKADLKKNLDRQPTEGERLVDGNDLKTMLDEKTKGDDMIRKQTKTLVSQQKGREVTVDDFKLIKVLGKGGFGIVFMVEDKKTKTQYAMKVLKKDFIMKHGQLENTKVEKLILEHVNHPYLVSLIFAFQDPKHLYFVTELMKCGELYEHMVESRKFSEKRAKFYTIQLALGLGHLHSKGFVYRDLKLENILVDEKGNVHLADFGLSKLIKSDELAMSICGTPEYMSPEVIKGQGCDMTTDWWALGTLVYEMMFGLPPFYSKIKNQMLDRIKNEELRFPPKPSVTDEAKDFITKCLNKDRTKRIGCQKDVEEILSHPWFAGTDFEAFLQKKIPPPFVPDPSKNYLDDQVSNMVPRISEAHPKEGFQGENDPFQDF